ncbi:RnfABCDGE type electron transport complex subunit D [Marichromatium sp. PS1]|uniref:RnfABCDGE type electron transport complex subunit D n=1 Tax=Marichromatium sp. PS1 TaxID=3138932 RepID=UPI0032E5C6C5
MHIAPPAIAGPFVHGGASIARDMRLVMLALLPATLFGLWQFGWPALLLFAVTLATVVVTEALCLWLAGRPLRPFLGDGSALLTGWLLALSLPPWAPWWIGVIGGVIAILIAKQVFGGIGQNPFNPAMVARVALLIAFPVEMTSFITPAPLGSDAAPGLGAALAIVQGGAPIDAYSGATTLGVVRTALDQGEALGGILGASFAPLDAALGLHGGSLGETSALLLLLGGLGLILTRVIGWQIPAAMLGTLALLATVMHLHDPTHYPDATYHLLGGATMLGAFFIATDPTTSPVSARGRLIFGAGCGLLVYVIRTWAGYPEGVAFAVLLMNACTPVIDHYVRPRIHGRDRRGRPLVGAESPEARR